MDEEKPRVLEKREWMQPPLVGRDFGDPPPPQLKFLQPRIMPWQNEKELTLREQARICKWQRGDDVIIRQGTLDTNMPGRPPRPRSAVVVKSDIANLNALPRPSQHGEPEAVYLVHCDSTETTLARGPERWYRESELMERRLGEPKPFVDDRPRFSKKYGGRAKRRPPLRSCRHSKSCSRIGRSPKPRRRSRAPPTPRRRRWR